MKLSDVKGVGGSAARKLQAAGVTTIEALAALDLRSVTVEGLSSSHIAKLRENAVAFLDAQSSGDLKLVKGLGPSAQRKLERAGIATIEALAELDLRRTNVKGLSTENLQKLKRNARYLLPGA